MKTISNFLTNKNIVIIQSIWEKHINYVYRILNFIVNNDRKEIYVMNVKSQKKNILEDTIRLKMKFMNI